MAHKLTNADVLAKGGLVHWAASLYWRPGNPNIDDGFADVLQAAWVGVLRACERYDPDKGSLWNYVLHNARRYAWEEACRLRAPLRPQHKGAVHRGLGYSNVCVEDLSGCTDRTAEQQVALREVLDALVKSPRWYDVVSWARADTYLSAVPGGTKQATHQRVGKGLLDAQRVLGIDSQVHKSTQTSRVLDVLDDTWRTVRELATRSRCKISWTSEVLRRSRLEDRVEARWDGDRAWRYRAKQSV